MVAPQEVGKEEVTKIDIEVADIEQAGKAFDQKAAALDAPCSAPSRMVVAAGVSAEDVGIVTLSRKATVGAWLMVAFNFLLANVGDGLGPIQAVYLVSAKGWSAGTAGTVWMCREVALMAASPYVGSLFDHVERKRPLLAGFMTFLTAVNLVIMFTDEVWVLVLRAFIGGAAQSAIRCGFSSITLGIVGPRNFEAWAAKGESANHVGSVVALLIAGVVSYLYFPDVYFLFAVFGVFGVAGVICVLFVPLGVIDYDRARNLTATKGRGKPSMRVRSPVVGDIAAAPSSASPDKPPSSATLDNPPSTATLDKPVAKAELLRNKNLVLWHAVIFFFHMSNSPVLPLLGQVVSDPVGTQVGRRLSASSSDKEGMLWACGLIVICNFVSAIVAASTNAMIQRVSWKALLFLGFLGQLPRTVGIALIMRFADSNRILLSATQILDGVAAAVNGMSCMVVTGILTEGSGRFGAVTGTINMVWAAAAGISNVSIGFVADQSYEVAFYICGGVGVLTVILVALLKIESVYDREVMDKRSISAHLKLARTTSIHSLG